MRNTIPDDEVRLSLRKGIMEVITEDLEDIGLEKVQKLIRMYGKDDLRVKKEKLECFFRAYAICGTVQFACQAVGLNPKVVGKLIRENEYYAARFDEAHDELCQYLEQVALVRAVQKSDTLLMFMLRANNPKKFSERLRLKAEDMEDTTPIQLVFYGDQEAPNYLLAGEGVDEVDVDREEDDDE